MQSQKGIWKTNSFGVQSTRLEERSKTTSLCTEREDMQMIGVAGKDARDSVRWRQMIHYVNHKGSSQD